MTKNPSLYVLYLTHGLFMFASVMLVPLFAIFATEFEASVETIAFLGTVFFMAKAAGTIFTRLFGVRFVSPLSNLRIGYSAKIIGCLGFFFATGLPQLFVIQILLGFGEGLQAPAFRALMSTKLVSNKELVESADWEITLATTGMAGTAVGGLIVGMFGFDGVFLVMACVVTISLILSYRILDNTRSSTDS